LSESITSPHATVTLATEEEGASQNVRTELVAITSSNTSESSSLLEGTISIVHISVLNNSSILSNVSVVLWHTKLLNLNRALENRRFIHIVPNSIDVARALEVFKEILARPEMLSIDIKVINPNRFTRPALTNPRCLSLRISDENVSNVTFRLLSIFQSNTIVVNIVFFGSLNVRISDSNNSSVRLLNGVIHTCDIVSSEVLLIEYEVHVILSVLDIKPQNIKRESIGIEVRVSINDILSGKVFVLTERETKVGKVWHWDVTSELGEKLVVLSGRGSTEDKEFEEITLTRE